MSTSNSSIDPMRLKQPIVVNEQMKRLIAEAVAQVDPARIAMLRTLTPAERVRLSLDMICIAEKEAAIQLREREPHLSAIEAIHEVRRRGLLSE